MVVRKLLENKSQKKIISVRIEGRLKDFVARRYNTNTRQYEVWSTPITGYGEFEGLRLPIKGKAVWKLKEGDFAYIDMTITDLEYDVSKPYSNSASLELLKPFFCQVLRASNQLKGFPKSSG